MLNLTFAPVARGEPSPGATPRPASKHNHSAKALAAMLLAAIVSALVVAADALVDTYADGHLLLAWSILWAVAFAALALFAETAQSSAKRLQATLGSWQTRRSHRHADNALLALAQRNPRIMTELLYAIERTQAEREKVQLAHGRAWVEHRPIGTFNAAYTGPRVYFKESPVTGLPMHIQYVPH
jgi:hypothetical protein